MKIGNSISTLTLLFTQQEYDMLGTQQIQLDFKMDSVLGFLHIYKVGHPHAIGPQVSIVPNIGTTHPWRVLLSKSGTSKSSKWRFLNNLPVFSPESVLLIEDGNDNVGHWLINRPAMTSVSPQAKARKRIKTVETPADPPSAVAQLARSLPKPAAQVMTKEEYSDSAMYKALNDGLALVNKAMLHYGDRLTIDVQDKRIRALLEINGD